MKKYSKRIALLLLVATYSVFSHQPLFALDANGSTFRGPDPANGIVFFDGDFATSECSPGSTVLAGNSNIEKAMSFFRGKGLTPEQSAGIIGNLMAESGVIPDRQEDGQPWGRGGWGLAQWTASRRTNIVNALNTAGLGDLYKPEYMNRKTPADKVDQLLAFQLEFLWGELNTGYVQVLRELQSTTSTDDAAVLILSKFEIPADISGNIPIRTSNARGVLATYGGVAPTVDTVSGSAVSSTCNAGSGSKFQGDIVKTALSLAWDNTGHGKFKSDAKPEYQSAMDQYNGSVGQDPYSDCGVFVSTVMHASGADTEYPKRGTANQLAYLKSSQKYVQVETKNTADLKPGDIFIFSANPYGHTFIYTGPYKGSNGKDYSIAEASLYDHVPEAGSVYFDSGSRRTFLIFRLK